MTVAIILSSYNGAKFLDQQLASIRRQSFQDFVLLIRDDGSKDGTAEIIQHYVGMDSRFKCHFGANIGAARSYFKLIENVGGEFEYCAFCDQDDIWASDKLERAIAALSKSPESLPSMYFSALNVVDEKLRHLFFTPPPRRKIGIRNAIVENIATGCSIVVNRTLLDLIQKNSPDASRVFMHDWWTYLIASALGNAIFDPYPTVLYRQHGGNVIGLKAGVNKILGGFKTLLSPVRPPKISTQLTEFLRLFGDRLKYDDRCTINDLVENAASKNFVKRLKSIAGRDYYRQSRINDIGLVISIALNRI